MNGVERVNPTLARYFTVDTATARRVLASHVPHRHGWCVGCGEIRHTPFPCVLATAAEHALVQLGLIPRQRGPHAD